MNTQSIFHLKPIYTSIPPSWNQNNQPLYSTTINHNLPYSITSWKLHAQSKGFGSGGSNSMQKKENVPNPGSNQEDDDDKIEPVVFERMIKRILTSVGLPMALGVVLLKLFDVLKAKQIWDVPIWVSFLTTFVFLGSSVLGVAYGSLSTSWDPEKKGSLLGFEEAKYNWDEMWKEEEDRK